MMKNRNTNPRTPTHHGCAADEMIDTARRGQHHHSVADDKSSALVIVVGTERRPQCRMTAFPALLSLTFVLIIPLASIHNHLVGKNTTSDHVVFGDFRSYSYPKHQQPDGNVVAVDDGDVDVELDYADTEVQWYNTSSIGDKYYDYFSATWIQPVHNFITNVEAKELDFVEDACHNVYEGNQQHVRMSVDWLDFCVEHLSKWWKLLDVTNALFNDIAIRRISDNFMAYMESNIVTKGSTLFLHDDGNNNSKPEWVWVKDSHHHHHDHLLHPTIAAIAFQPAEEVASTNDVTRDRSILLTVTALSATIASLTKAGFGRIIIVGADDTDRSFVELSIKMLLMKDETTTATVVPSMSSSSSSPLAGFLRGQEGNGIITMEGTTTEYAFIKIQNSSWLQTKSYDRNLPRATMMGLQLALREAFSNTTSSTHDNHHDYHHQKSELQKLWLGSLHPSTYWKYVYLTEPDTILNMKSSARRSIHSALEEGLVLMPHRLQPIPHEGDVAGTDSPVLFTPPPPHNDMNLSHLPEEDRNSSQYRPDHMVINIEEENIMCCDMGNHHPGKDDYPNCRNFWYMCGFHELPDGTIAHEHERFDKYQFMKILPPLGTGIITLAGSEHSRQCRPTRRLDGEGCPSV